MATVIKETNFMDANRNVIDTGVATVTVTAAGGHFFEYLEHTTTVLAAVALVLSIIYTVIRIHKEFKE